MIRGPKESSSRSKSSRSQSRHDTHSCEDCPVYNSVRCGMEFRTWMELDLYTRFIKGGSCETGYRCSHATVYFTVSATVLVYVTDAAEFIANDCSAPFPCIREYFVTRLLRFTDLRIRVTLISDLWICGSFRIDRVSSTDYLTHRFSDLYYTVERFFFRYLSSSRTTSNFKILWITFYLFLLIGAKFLL